MVRTKHRSDKNTTVIDNGTLEWRQEDAPPQKPLQHGIAPSQFYREGAGKDDDDGKYHAGRRRQRNQLKKVLDQACTNTIRERRREVTTKQKLKRAAYKEVTCLRTWPLQNIAMEDLDRLLTGETRQEELLPEKEHGDSTGLSSSSMDEPKRIKPQDETLSPRKSTMRNLFKQEFLREQEIPVQAENSRSFVKPKQDNQDSIQNDSDEDDGDNVIDNKDESDCKLISTSHDFLPALWCMEPRMFAVEKSSAGKRKYLVGQLGRFLDLYWRKCDPKNRHYYELIREKTPCRLYFDLEFSKMANPEITEEMSEMLLNEFFKELAVELQRVHDIRIDRSCVVDLDSSTDSKFSRHWIVHLPNQALFADAGATGRFVKTFVGRLAEEAATGVLLEKCPTLQDHLFVNTKSVNTASQSPADSQMQGGDGANAKSGCSSTPTITVSPTQGGDCTTGVSPISQERNSVETTCTPCSQEKSPSTCFVDLGVYTRNRLFRLLGSSKFGKPASAALRIASSNTFPFPIGFANDSFYIPDIEKKTASSATNDTGKENSELESDMSKFLSTVDWTVHAQALAETLVVPINGSKLSFPILKDSGHNASDVSGSKVKSAALSSSDAMDRKVSVTSASGAERSPFPGLDDYVINVLGTRGGVQGAIRVWSIDYGNYVDGGAETPHVAQFITYQMCRNRWCERIGRPHKSNNIMWTVDLQAMTCVQSCHDPECRTMRFRGNPVALPKSVREYVQDDLFEQQLALMDEKALLQKQKSASRQAELDDAEFELALLKLDISGKQKKEDEPTSHQIELPKSEQDVGDGTTSTDLLSDSLLCDAVLTNPELFP